MTLVLEPQTNKNRETSKVRKTRYARVHINDIDQLSKEGFTHCLKITQNVAFVTVQNLHFLSKNSTLISSENCRIFFSEKLVKML